MKLNDAIDLRIKNLCDDRHCTLYKLAKLGGINKETLYQIKSCKDIKLSTIHGVCATFGITFKEFFDSPIFDEVID